MIPNPPFPYTCRIIHYESVSSFAGESGEEVLYDGPCDVEGNKYPTLKEGVLVNKVKVFIDDLSSQSRIYHNGDKIIIDRLGQVETYVLNDYWPTNFGTTIQCDIASN